MRHALPSALAAALGEMADGHGLAGLRGSAAAMSEAYRARQGSDAVIRDAGAALAYALTRMPATFAAASAALEQLAGVLPDFRPVTLLDAGCGPGSAAFAAAATLGPLRRVTLVDRNAPLLALAKALAGRTPDLIGEAEALAAPLDAFDPGTTTADLVTAGYALSELPEREADRVLDRLWRAAGAALLVIEPGTPAGFGAVRRFRDRLIAAGGRIAAPCPHDLACPMAGGDWCHFKVRLPRLRLHKALKSADLGYEDEPFAFVAAMRDAPPSRPAARVIAPAVTTKAGVSLKLCRDGVSELRQVASRDRAAFAAARRLGWGDGVR
jgi:ribosomal protein RSM22 (predicted rRNA methylase)